MSHVGFHQHQCHFRRMHVPQHSKFTQQLSSKSLTSSPAHRGRLLLCHAADCDRLPAIATKFLGRDEKVWRSFFTIAGRTAWNSPPKEITDIPCTDLSVNFGACIAIFTINFFNRKQNSMLCIYTFMHISCVMPFLLTMPQLIYLSDEISSDEI